MKIEILYPEICNLYGELGNIRYLQKSLPEAEFINTHINDTPKFINEAVDMVYMGTMTENSQLMVIDALSQYKDVIRRRIDEGMNFLITGNAVEVFGKAIIEDDRKVAEGLGIFDIEARRSSRHRVNHLYVGDFSESDGEAPVAEVCAAEGEYAFHGPLKVVGFKSLFGYGYGADFEHELMTTILGYGSNEETKKEGIRVNNFIATYLTGPLFVLNPLFMKWYMIARLGIENAQPAFCDEAMDAYKTRLDEYLTPNKGWQYH